MHNILLTVQHEPGVEDVLKKKKKDKNCGSDDCGCH